MYSRSSEVRNPPAPEGSDPLSAVLSLLNPEPLFSEIGSPAEKWSVRYGQCEDFIFALVLGGQCFIEGDDIGVLFLADGDFVLFSQTAGFTLASQLDLEPALEAVPAAPKDFLELLHDQRARSESSQVLVGRFRVGRAASPSLLRLLPSLVHIRRDEPGAHRIRRIVAAVTEEVDTKHPARRLALEGLLEVLLVEALRFRPMFARRQEPGLLVGLSDACIARALREIHGDVTRDWTVADLAQAAGMSRAEFAEQFVSKVGLPPLQYLLEWRMAIARDMLARERLPRAEVAERVGYQCANAFSTAFARVVGCSPSEFARSIE